MATIALNCWHAAQKSLASSSNSRRVGVFGTQKFGFDSLKFLGCRKPEYTSFQLKVKASNAQTEFDPYAGVELYKPATYDALIKDAARSVSYALNDKKTRLEVEFPPLPSSVAGYKGQSDDFIDANLQLAFALARELKATKGLVSRLVVPDGPEKRRASRILKSAFMMEDGIFLGSLEDIPETGVNIFGTMKNILDLDFEGTAEGSWLADVPVDVQIVINASTAELPAVEKYVGHFASNSPVILFNLELDTLRADLGLFGFPQKSVHYAFLSFFTPAFYIRTRDYSKSVPVPPYILNYSGALLRQYPAPWQVMVKQSDGSYACVAENDDRFTLGQVKQELLFSLGMEEEEGSTMAFLRRGYKTSTWWEEDAEFEMSNAWRK